MKKYKDTVKLICLISTQGDILTKVYTWKG